MKKSINEIESELMVTFIEEEIPTKTQKEIEFLKLKIELMESENRYLNLLTIKALAMENLKDKSELNFDIEKELDEISDKCKVLTSKVRKIKKN